MSETIYTALHAFQAEAPKLQKDKINPAFRSKYLSLDALMEQILPVLNKHGLVWITRPERRKDEPPVLTYELLHVTALPETAESLHRTSGIRGEMPLMLTKQDPQGMGSAITYARRQSLMAVLGLSADEDDDANAASKRSRFEETTSVPRVPTARAARPTTATASAKQRGLVNGKAAEKGLDPATLANIVLKATGNPERTFASQTDAERFLKMGMDRIPASAVGGVLAGIAEVEQAA